MSTKPTKKFESEIRILIKDINAFLKKLEEFKANVIYHYKFIDYIYIPKNTTSNWNPNKKTMRIREHILPEQYSQILFTENEVIQGEIFQFKQSKYPQGKIELFRGNRATAEALLHSWEFRPVFKIEKLNGKLYEIEHPKKFIIAVEEITQLGFSAEIERWGENLLSIEKEFLEIIKLLEIPLELVTSNTLPYIVAERLNILFENYDN